MATAKETLLCAIKFWSGIPGEGSRAGQGTLRKGPRKVARTQGFTPSELDKAERELVREGFITRPRAGVVALTSRGIQRGAKSCARVSLAPWDNRYATAPRRHRG